MSDTFESYLPTYQRLVGMIRSGNLNLFSFTIGFGANALIFQTLLADIFNLPAIIAGLLFGIPAVADGLIWSLFLRVLSAAIVCFYFLKCFPLSSYARILASVGFAFSGFIVGIQGQHFFFGSNSFMICLILLCIEKSIKRRKNLIWLALSVFWCASWSYYTTYMVLLAAAIYALFRCYSLQKGDTVGARAKSASLLFLPMFISVVVGILLAGVILVPAAYYALTVSSRIGSADISFAELFMPLEFKQYLTYIMRFFTDSYNSNSFNWPVEVETKWSVAIYTGLLFIPAFPQYIANLIKNRRISHIVIVCILILSFFSPLTGFVFNAFSYLSVRYMFLYMPALAYVVAVVIDNIFVRNLLYKKTLVISVCAAILYAAILFQWKLQLLLPLYIGILLALGIFAVAMLAANTKYRKIAAFAILAAVAVTSVLEVQASAVWPQRNYMHAWYRDNYRVSGMEELLAHAEEVNGESFYRVERAYVNYPLETMYNYTAIEPYRGISWYDSVLNKNYVSFLDEFVLARKPTGNSGLYSMTGAGKSFDPVVADIMGIKYVLSNYPYTGAGWEQIGTYGNQLAYQNQSLGTGGLFYKQYITQSEYDQLSTAQKHFVGTEYVVVPDDAVIVNGEHTAFSDVDTLLFAELEPMEHESAFALDVPTKEYGMPADGLKNVWEFSLALTQPSGEPVDGLLTIQYDTGFGYKDTFWSNDNLVVNGSETITVLVPSDTELIRVIFVPESYVHGYTIGISNSHLMTTSTKSYSNEGINLQNPGSASYVSVKVQGEGGLLLLPIAMQEGWELRVDGEATDIISLDYGLIGADLSAGEHTIELEYDTPMLKQGLAMSVIGLIALISFVVFLFTRKRKNQKIS